MLISPCDRPAERELERSQPVTLSVSPQYAGDRATFGQALAKLRRLTVSP
jgi:hypothetical protein